LLATLIGEVDMKVILILALAAVPVALVGCGKPSQERAPAVEEVRPAPPPPAVMPPETTMMRPESTPSQGTMPDTTGMQHY
jgi:hypothetical protein